MISSWSSEFFLVENKNRSNNFIARFPFLKTRTDKAYKTENPTPQVGMLFNNHCWAWFVWTYVEGKPFACFIPMLFRRGGGSKKAAGTDVSGGFIVNQCDSMHPIRWTGAMSRTDVHLMFRTDKNVGYDRKPGFAYYRFSTTTTFCLRQVADCGFWTF